MIETERLILRLVTPDDSDELMALQDDPEVMRFLDPSPVERFLGGGFYAGIEKASGRFIGWLALEPMGQDSYEIGWRLHRWAWGAGLGTEGAKALLDMGFRDLGAERIHAETMTVNERSRRVMAKIGLRYVRTFIAEWDAPLPGSDQGEVEYALTRAEYLAQKA